MLAEFSINNSFLSQPAPIESVRAVLHATTADILQYFSSNSPYPSLISADNSSFLCSLFLSTLTPFLCLQAFGFTVPRSRRRWVRNRTRYSRSWRIRRHSNLACMRASQGLSATRRRRQGWPQIPIAQRTSGRSIERRCLFSISCQTGVAPLSCRQPDPERAGYYLLRFEQRLTPAACAARGEAPRALECVIRRDMWRPSNLVAVAISQRPSLRTLLRRTSHQYLRL